MADSKVLLSYNFMSDMNNAGDSKYSFSEFGSAYNILNGYIGSTLSSLDTFNLDIDWKISFYYQWRSNLGSTWNHLFAFGVHKSSSMSADIVSYAIGIGNVKSNTKKLYTLRSLDKNNHFYEIEYYKKAKAMLIKIDHKLVNTIEDIEMPKKQEGLYLSGGSNGTVINAKISNFKFEIFYEKTDVVLNTRLKRIVTQSLNAVADTVLPSNLKLVTSSIPALKRNIVTSYINDSADDDAPVNEKTTTKSDLSSTRTYVDNKYLVSLNFNDNFINDFGTLKFAWKGPKTEHFVNSKFSENNPVKKSLYFDGTYEIESYRPYIAVPEIRDFCIELDFIVSEDAEFTTPYSRMYLLSSNINTVGEFHSTLADIYLLPKYKDEEETVSLTIESNDLFRNTGNIIYTYGWIKRDTKYSLVYTREGNRFFVLINDELVYDKILDNTITYEPGYSKPNRRYFGPNYINKLEIGLGKSVLPTNTQDKFVGYIDKFNISGVARFNIFGKPINLIKQCIIQTYPIKQEFSPWVFVSGKVYIIKPGGTFTIEGFTIYGGPGGVKLVGGPGNRLIIYSGPENVNIYGPSYPPPRPGSPPGPGRYWVIPGGGYYGVLHAGVFTIVSKTIEFEPTKIISNQIIFIGHTETYVLKGVTIKGVIGGVIVLVQPDGSFIIKHHIYPITVIDIKGTVHTIEVGYIGTVVQGIITITTGIVVPGARDFPIPPWVKIIQFPELYNNNMVQNIEKDVLLYVPCKKDEFDNDVIYSKIVPRENNFKAIKVGGNFYRDYWREGYGAIGPR